MNESDHLHPFLRAITSVGRESRLLHVQQIPSSEGIRAPWPQWVDGDLVSGWKNNGVESPWLHQSEAADSLWAKQHTIIATTTGSGKSLSMWTPALTRIRSGDDPAHRRPTVLYLCPTKALGVDQQKMLSQLLDSSSIRDVYVAVCDGDTPFEQRRWIQAHADAVLTNPDLLHFSLLPGHTYWSRFIRNLEYVIVDEVHAYRGILGAHVSAVLRRLRRLCNHYGSNPTFALASATTTDPADSASRLTGIDASLITAITSDSSTRGARTFVLWEPPLIPPEPPATEETRRSVLSETSDLLADVTAAGARSLAFVQSRRAAETVASMTSDELGRFAAPLRRSVAAYRGGYLPEERRAIENDIRTGNLKALATTNALELGVDISGLDCVFMAGWPGSRASMWQQAGRAGRAGQDGLAVLLARDNPLDSYLVHHPESIFDAEVEATVFDPENPYVLAPHLCAAAQEIPLTTDDEHVFGQSMTPVLDALSDDGLLRKRPHGWFWTSTRRAADLTDLRGSNAPAISIVEESTGRLLGTVDDAAAPAQVHPGAIYVHQGSTFTVRDLDLEERVALVEQCTVDYTTYSSSKIDISIVEEVEQRVWSSDGSPRVTWSLGFVDVDTQVTAYQRRRLVDGVVTSNIPLDMPRRSLRTSAVWWTVPEETLARARIEREEVAGALHAAEHASIGLLPLMATCDQWDIGGMSTPMHIDTMAATVFVHDGYPGGAGFAERGFHTARTWTQATRDAIEACDCRSGCPSCVQSPSCGSNNTPLEKDAASRLLTVMLAAT